MRFGFVSVKLLDQFELIHFEFLLACSLGSHALHAESP
jgi:hypothetical protein